MGLFSVCSHLWKKLSVPILWKIKEPSVMCSGSVFESFIEKLSVPNSLKNRTTLVERGHFRDLKEPEVLMKAPVLSWPVI